MSERNNRFRGALLGLACGDALGAPVEFCRKDSYPLQTEMTGGGAFGLKSGEWTDDTAMALCMAESLTELQAFSTEDQMARYQRWFRHGYQSCQGRCVDIGNTTVWAIKRFERTGIAMAGTDDPFKSGNGNIMRLAPAVMVADSQKTAIELALLSSRVTHASDDCLDAAELMAVILWRTLQGEPLPQLLHSLPDINARSMAIGRVVHGYFRSLNRQEVNASGYVINSLEAALWCCYHSRSLEEALILAANLGDDTDTVAAITGQLAGAHYGASALPGRWTNVLAWQERIGAYGDELEAVKIRCDRTENDFDQKS